MNADPLSRWYRWLEYAGFGRSLEKRRFAFLSEIEDARRVLMLGEGDGRFLAAFTRANPQAEIDCVDSSARMLELANARAHGNRARFHHAEAREWIASRIAGSAPPYDLIVTHFFLDCFTEAELVPLVANLAGMTAEGAGWVVSEFRQPSGGFARWYARAWIGGLYAFFQMATGLHVTRLPDYAARLRAGGFRLQAEHVAHFGMLTSQFWRKRPGAEGHGS